MTAIPVAEKGPNVRARFYRDEDTKQIWFEANVLSSKDVYVAKARPEHIEKYAREYEAFDKGQEDIDVGGTSLLEVPGVTKDVARKYKLAGVRNAEELAGLSDGSCTQLGLGVLTARKAAQNMLAARENEALKAQLAALKRKS